MEPDNNMFSQNNIHEPEREIVEQDFLACIKNISFPCIAAKSAASGDRIACLVADHIACPKDDTAILRFLYDFIDEYRANEDLFHSAAIIFKGPLQIDETVFEQFFWSRLQALSDLDALQYTYDSRVDSDPHSGHFSFSLKQEAFFIIGMHPGNARLARRYKYPVIIFNPHAQFEKLRDQQRFDKIREVVRKRDIRLSGTINPMLSDFGDRPEVFQYTGRNYPAEWECPLKISHVKH
jgi:FPC/CPF motif-containing protein YcgG